MAVADAAAVPGGGGARPGCAALADAAAVPGGGGARGLVRLSPVRRSATPPVGPAWVGVDSYGPSDLTPAG